MKKILNLLTVLAISGVSIPKVTAFSSSSEQKKGTTFKTEIKLYYNEDNKKNKIIFNDLYIESDGWHLSHTFNLGTNNSINYKKIMFLGEKNDFFQKLAEGKKCIMEQNYLISMTVK